MRDKFELYCKALGLALLCWGVIASLSMIPLYFHPPRTNMLLPSTLTKSVLSQQAIKELDQAQSKMYAWISLQFALQGIIPALLGCYLMRRNNLVIRTCYPDDATTPPAADLSELKLELGQPRSPQRREPEGDERFAPPGP